MKSFLIVEHLALVQVFKGNKIKQNPFQVKNIPSCPDKVVIISYDKPLHRPGMSLIWEAHLFILRK